MSATTDHGENGFFGVAAARPDRVALVAGTTTITYGRLATRATELAGGLRGLGLGIGDVLVLVARNDPAYFELTLAAQLAGLHLVPMSSQSTAREIGHVVGDSSAAVLVASDVVIDALGDVEFPCHRYAIGDERGGWPHYSTLRTDATRPAGDDVVRTGGLLPYTSGTTGRPKGVLRPMRDQRVSRIGGPLADARSRTFALTPGAGVHLVCSPLHHNAPGTFAQVALHLGHTVVLHERFDAARTLAEVETHRVTWTHMVPAHFQRLLALPEEQRARADVSSLETVLHAGAPCPPRVKAQMVDWLGPIVWEYYGATEGLVSVLSPEDWRRRPDTVGRPAPGVRVSILDDEGCEQESGAVGQVWFSTDAPYSYLGDASKTGTHRRGGLVTVGDLGSLDDGFLTLHDRRSDLIISGGVNVYPAEVEGVLASHPDVIDCVVVGVTSERWGQEVVAVVELSPLVADPDAVTADVQGFLERELAAYKRPKRLILRDLPRAENGKVSRAAIKRWVVDDAQSEASR